MPDQDREDSESLPETQAYPPPGFDTDTSAPLAQPRAGAPEPEGAPEQAAALEPDSPTVDAPSEPVPASARSVAVPGRYHYVKWWQFVLVLLGVWMPAAAIGPSLFNWWTEDHSPHKTSVVFVVLIYVVVCTVAGLMLAMAPDKPLVSALAIAVMSAPFASVAAAAPFYGAFYCDHWSGPCLFGIIPH